MLLCTPGQALNTAAVRQLQSNDAILSDLLAQRRLG